MSNDRAPTDDAPSGRGGSGPEGTPWEALEQLAAGELSAEEAQALRTRIDAEPALRSAYASVAHVEAALKGEPLWQAPLGLTTRVLESIVPRRRSRLMTFARVAAAVLVFFSSWIAFSGTAPAWADVKHPAPYLEQVPELTPRVELTTSPSALLDATSPASVDVGATILMLVGMLVLVAGMVLLIRVHMRAASAKGGV